MTSDFYKRPLFLILLIYSLCLALFLPKPEPRQKDISAYITPSPQEIVLEVISYPELRQDGQYFYCKVLSVGENAVIGKSYASCLSCGDISRGDKLTAKAIIEPVFSQDNYGSFNWRDYQARKYVFSQIKLQEVLSLESPSLFWSTLSKLRGSMLSVFRENLPADMANVLSGIAIGEKGDINDGLYTAFQDSGAIHLLVASGGNVGFVTLIVFFLCSIVLPGRYFPVAAALTGALFYTLIAGADAPLVRAYIMTLFSAIGLVLGRKSGVLQGFLMAALVILVFNPQSIFDAGFQMSFLASLFIIYFACNFNFISRMPKIAAWACGLFFVSLSAQLALLPIFTNYFNRVSFAAVLSNIFLVPLSGVLMAGAFVLWLFSFIPLTFLFKSTLFGVKALLFVFNFLVESFAALPFAGMTAASWFWPYIIAYYASLFAVFNYPLFKNKLRFLCLLLVPAAVFCVYAFVYPSSFSKVLNGRYNQSLLIKEHGNTSVIGAGLDYKTLRLAVLASGSKEIDCLFINSIYKSAVYALKEKPDIKIKKIYIPSAELSKESAEYIKNTGAVIYRVSPGEKICQVKVLAPWFAGKDGLIRESPSKKNLSFSYDSYNFAGDMKAYKKEDKLFLYN